MMLPWTITAHVANFPKVPFLFILELTLILSYYLVLFKYIGISFLLLLNVF